nr:fibronectin type III-like domain-contianing protein [Chitinophagaceae bacterium]
LKKGESKTVVFKLSPADLQLADNAGNYYQPAGEYTFYIGGGQPEVNTEGASIPVMHKIKIVP